jgi:acetyl-CoA carboxylase biotin carboxyl carrier protein
MTLSYSEVADIVKIVDASSCDEVILELEGTRLVIKRGGTISAPASQPTALVSETPQSTPVPAAEPVATDIAAPAAGSSGPSICSPMVGTFYARPTPDDAPFVEVGTKVTVGTPLCVIEVMKLFTTIKSTQEGVVGAVLAQDGQLVDYDQPLFVIQSN